MHFYITAGHLEPWPRSAFLHHPTMTLVHFTTWSVDHGHLVCKGSQEVIWNDPGALLYIDQGYLKINMDLAQMSCFIYHLDQNFKEILNLAVLQLYLFFIGL